MMRERKERIIAAVVILLVFALGVVVGTHGARIATHRHIDALFRGTAEEAESHVLMMALRRELHLDERQIEAARDIFRKHAPAHAKLRDKIEPELVTLRAEERAELRAVLTDEQKAKFDAITEKLDDRRKRLARVLDH